MEVGIVTRRGAGLMVSSISRRVDVDYLPVRVNGQHQKLPFPAAPFLGGAAGEEDVAWDVAVDEPNNDEE